MKKLTILCWQIGDFESSRNRRSNRHIRWLSCVDFQWLLGYEKTTRNLGAALLAIEYERNRLTTSKEHLALFNCTLEEFLRHFITVGKIRFTIIQRRPSKSRNSGFLLENQRHGSVSQYSHGDSFDSGLCLTIPVRSALCGGEWNKIETPSTNFQPRFYFWSGSENETIHTNSPCSPQKKAGIMQKQNPLFSVMVTEITSNVS